MSKREITALVLTIVFLAFIIFKFVSFAYFVKDPYNQKGIPIHPVDSHAEMKYVILAYFVNDDSIFDRFYRPYRVWLPEKTVPEQIGVCRMLYKELTDFFNKKGEAWHRAHDIEGAQEPTIEQYLHWRLNGKEDNTYCRHDNYKRARYPCDEYAESTQRLVEFYDSLSSDSGFLEKMKLKYYGN